MKRTLSIPLTMLVMLGFPVHASLNVTNFGAVGDCNQVWVSTVSNSVVVQFTNTLPWPASSNKTVELFAVGAVNIPDANSYNQDLIAVITNVVAGTNVYLSGDVPKRTAANVYCVYGANNAGAFQAAVDAATGPSTDINIPAGNFLLIPPMQYTNYTYSYYPYGQIDAGILINKGGLHFVGASRDATILTADGAFKNQGFTCMRAMVFAVNGPVTNDYPLIWDSLTFDGGLQAGLTGNQGIQPATWYSGIGWDGTSAAGVDQGSEPLHTFKEFTNCKFQHFRGEMIKGITGSAGNETILVTNCFFWDGNATAFNYNFAHTIAGCTFSNMYQIEEFYLQYPANAGSYFINNFATNIQHNLVSLNGGTLTNQPYVISNNVFYCNMNGNGIATCPAANVYIFSNIFNEVSGASTLAIVIGQSGPQAGSADACNTNILIVGNVFSNSFYTYISAGGISASDINRTEGLKVYGNQIIGAQNKPLLDANSWTRNISIYGNEFNGAPLTLVSGGFGSGYALVATNNNYFTRLLSDGEQGMTNSVSYGGGASYQLIYPYTPGYTAFLYRADSNQIPPVAAIQIRNVNDNGTAVPVYTDESLTKAVSIPYGATMLFFWNTNLFTWQTNAVSGGGGGGGTTPLYYPIFRSTQL